MLESFSAQAIQIIEEAKNQAKKLNSNIVGSEHLLLAMYETSDSICRFLLQEQNITYDDLISTINKITVIHKTSKDDVTFTDKFQEIILSAEEISKINNSKYVFDEHIFYSLLDDEANVGAEMLKILNLDIEVLKRDVEDIFNLYSKNDEEDLSPYPFLINLSKQAMVHPFIKRSNYIERINYILNKKQKNNPLLIGSAGVGKTAIVEGLASVRGEDTIYQLDLGGCVAGTKYRGELEEKILKVMDFVRENKAILFIDEIHNIVGAGSNDGSLDIANILKPYLSRTDLSVIGATTLDEYYNFINKDKALMRRFQTIFIDEPSIDETKEILLGIKETYEEFHNFQINEKELYEIITQTSLYLPQKCFPDKAIDVLDEIGSRYEEGKKIIDLLKNVIYDQTNIYACSESELRGFDLNYNNLKPLYLKFIKRFENYKNIGVLNVESDFNVDFLLEDLYKVFHFKKEMFLEINLDIYQDYVMINNLIGSSKGYVGYDEGGIISEHIIKYPLSLIYFKNFDKAHYSIKNLLNKIMSEYTFLDNKGRKIVLQNTLFIVEKKNEKRSVGFIEKNELKTELQHLKAIKKQDWLSLYVGFLKEHNITISNIEKLNISKEAFIDLVYKLLLDGKGCYYINDDLTYKLQKQ